MNPESVMKCAHCGAPTRKAAPTVAPQSAAPMPARSSAPKKSNRMLAIGLGAVAVVCLAAIIIFAVLSGRTEGHNGIVQSIGWTTSIVVEALQPVTRQDWKESIPPEAQLGACTLKIHHVQDQPDPSASNNKVCGTPYTVDKGSGFAEVVQDCKYEVLLDFCDYTVMDWLQVDVLELQGSDYSPAWPAPQLAADQRLGAQSAAFQVVFKTDDGAIVYTPGDLSEFQSFQIGSEWILNINTFGAILSVEPLR